MSNKRFELNALLKEILGSDNVYFQPPPTLTMKYPAIVYAREGFEEKHADDSLYFRRTKYKITIIDKNPDSTICDDVANLPQCKFERHYKVDNLNHDVYSLYF